MGKQGGQLCQVVATKAADLVYLADRARSRRVHPFLSRIGRPGPQGEASPPDQLHRPDLLIFDLDPPGTGQFEAVRTAALRLREILEGDLGLAAFVKTTGSKGLHVQVPLNGREEFDPVRDFARQVAELLAAAEPTWSPWNSARKPGRAVCTRTSCATPTPRPRWLRTRSAPGPAPRSPRL